MALDIDLIRLGFKFEYTKNWCRLGMLLGSLVKKNRIVAWVKLEISMKIRVHLVEKEHVVQRQPSHPQALF